MQEDILQVAFVTITTSFVVLEKVMEADGAP